jgi:hypothetical protein
MSCNYENMVCFQITVSFDETTTLEDVDKLFKVFAGGKPVSTTLLLHVSIKVVTINHNLENNIMHFFLSNVRSLSQLHLWHQRFRM